MSSPGASQAVVRPDLRGVVARKWDVSGEMAMMVANQIAPRIDVPFASGTIRRIPREAMTKDVASLDRGPDGDYPSIEWSDDSFTYATKEQGLAVPIDANLKAQTAIYYDAEVAAADISMSKAQRAHEKLVATKIFDPTVFTGSLTVAATANWNTSSSSATPVTDVQAARLQVRQNCGRDANTVIMPWWTFERCIETSQVLGRITGGANTELPARARIANLATLLGVNRIVIAGGIKDSANQGQNFVGAAIYDQTKVMVAYYNPQPTLFDLPGPLACYNWEGDGGSYEWTVEIFWDEDKRRWKVRSRRQVQVKSDYPECGVVITGCT